MQHMLHQLIFAQKAEARRAVIDDERGRGVDLVALRQIGKEGNLDSVGSDMIAENRELMGQPGHMATDGSRWRLEHLQMNRTPEHRQRLARALA